MDLRTLRALKGAPLSCYSALQIMAHAGVSDLSMVTGYDKDTVSVAARLLLMLGIARRDSARGDYWLIEEGSLDPQPAEPCAATAGQEEQPAPSAAQADREEPGAQPEAEKIGYLARSGSSSSLYLPPVKQESIKTTTTTTTVRLEAENIGLRDGPAGPETTCGGASGPSAADRVLSEARSLAPAEASLPPETKRIAEFLVARAACRRSRAVEAVAEALRAGDYPAWVELQILYWSAYVWPERGKGIQNPGAFVAARIAEGAPAPRAVDLKDWGDRDLERKLQLEWDRQDAIANAKAADTSSSDGCGEEDGGGEDTPEEEE